MMTSRAAFTLLASLAVVVVATPAQAALVNFTLRAGPVVGTFAIDTATAPTVYSLGKYADYHDVEIVFNKFPTRSYEVSFFTSSDLGGIGIAKPGGGEKSNFGGPQVFAGLVTDPQFKNGTYALVRTGFGGVGTLTISGAPSPVPLPPGLPLFATALTGLGLLGFGRSRGSIVAPGRSSFSRL